MEVMISLALITTAISGIMTLQIAITRHAELTKRSWQALYLAESKLEQLRADYIESENETFQHQSEDGGLFTIEVQIERNPYVVGMAWIVVSVGWLDKQSDPHQIELSTALYYAEN